MKPLLIALIAGNIGTQCPPNTRIPQVLLSDLRKVEHLMETGEERQALILYAKVKHRTADYRLQKLICEAEL